MDSHPSMRPTWDSAGSVDVPAWPCTWWGLPGRRVTTTPVRSYRTISPLPATGSRVARRLGGVFSVALSRGFPRVGVTDHHALRCPDFPRTGFLSGPRPSSQPNKGSRAHRYRRVPHRDAARDRTARQARDEPQSPHSKPLPAATWAPDESAGEAGEDAGSEACSAGESTEDEARHARGPSAPARGAGGCVAAIRRHWPPDPHTGQLIGFEAARPSHTRSRRCSSVVGLPPEGPGRRRGASSRPSGRWVSRKSGGRSTTAVLMRPS